MTPRALLAAERPGPAATAALLLAAVAVLVGGYLHARLFHRGYAEVFVVGPLFLLNAIGSTVVVLALLAERVRIFALGAVSISVGSVVSIWISHTSSFFGFAEGAYDPTAKAIVAAELVATAAALVGGALVLLQARTAGTAGAGA